MARIHRYGDDGTVVTAREKATAILFIVGVAALLVGNGLTAADEHPGAVAHAGSAMPASDRDNASGEGADATAPARASANGQN